MKCGERGHKNAAGEPCGQVIGPEAVGCWIHGGMTPEELHDARHKVRHLMLDSATLPRFTSRAEVVKFAELVANHVLRNGGVDHRRADTALRACNVALSAFQAETNEKLLEALLKLEHGGVAVSLLTNLQQSLEDRRSRPIPVKALKPKDQTHER